MILIALIWTQVDAELKNKYFKVAGNILSQIFEELVLDWNLVTAEYEYENGSIVTDGYDEDWVFKNCRICRYI